MLVIATISLWLWRGGGNSVHRWLLGQSCFRIWKCESLGLYSVPFSNSSNSWNTWVLSLIMLQAQLWQQDLYISTRGDQWFWPRFLWCSVSCWAVFIPDCDTVCQDAFYCAVVQKLQQSNREVGLHQGSEEVKSLLGLFDYGSRADRPFEVLVDMKAQELKGGHSTSSLPISSDSLVSP